MEPRALPVKDDVTTQEVLYQALVCREGEWVEIEDYDTESTVVVRCEELKNFADQYHRRIEGGEAPRSLPYLFRSRLPDLTSVAHDYAIQLKRYPLQGFCSPQEIIETGITSLPTPDDHLGPYLLRFLEAGLLRAFDYSGISFDRNQNCYSALSHVLFAFEGTLAIVAGLELLTNDSIEKWQEGEIELHGNLEDGTFSQYPRARHAGKPMKINENDLKISCG